MSDRIPPPSDLYAVCPSYGSVLAFYEGIFEAAYVLLHPFLRPLSISLDQLEPETFLSKEQICKSCEAVTWSEIQHNSGLRSINEIDLALRTQICGLKATYARPELAEILKTSLKRQGIWPPVEGVFSELIHDKVLSFIQSQGYERVWVGDEFGEERKLHWIEDLKSPDSIITEQCGCNVFTPDQKILWTTHWDSHFSFLCTSRSTVEKLVSEESFEGFECNPSTEVYWSLG